MVKKHQPSNEDQFQRSNCCLAARGLLTGWTLLGESGV